MNENKTNRPEKSQDTDVGNKTRLTTTSCSHEWELLDLGTGDYGTDYCVKCGETKRNCY